MKKILINYDEETGETFFEGLSSEIFQRGQLAAIERAFIASGCRDAQNIIFETTKEFAIKTVAKYNMFLISFARFRRRDTADILLKQLPQRGFGTGRIIEWDEQEKLVKIVVKNSFETFNVKAHAPVCFALAGIISGAYEVMFNQPCNCTQTRCAAIGDDECEFNCTPKKE